MIFAGSCALCDIIHAHFTKGTESQFFAYLMLLMALLLVSSVSLFDFEMTSLHVPTPRPVAYVVHTMASLARCLEEEEELAAGGDAEAGANARALKGITDAFAADPLPQLDLPELGNNFRPDSSSSSSYVRPNGSSSSIRPSSSTSSTLPSGSSSTIRPGSGNSDTLKGDRPVFRGMGRGTMVKRPS